MTAGRTRRDDRIARRPRIAHVSPPRKRGSRLSRVIRTGHRGSLWMPAFAGMTDDPSRRLHALRQTRRVRRRREPARSRARARRRSRFGLRRARHLRPLSGRHRRGRFRQARHSFERRSCDAVGSGRGPLRLEARTVRRRPPARLPGQDLRRSRHRRAARKPGSSASRAQARGDASDRDRSGRPPLLRRGRASRTCTSRRAICAALQQALHEQWDLDETHADLATLARPAEDVARGGMEGHRCAAQRPRHRVHHAGLRRARLRRRDRCRLHHHRRPPHRSHERRGRRSSRGDEPADPLRRRPDEPRFLRDDEPGRRQGADARGARGDGRADRRSRARGRGRARRDPGSDAGRQPDHASPRAWPRPDRARRGAVRVDRRRGLRSARARTRPRRRARRLCLRAALHRRPCRRRHGRGRARRGPASQGRADSSGRCRHQRRDRVRQSRAAVRLLFADRPGVRGRADLLRPARGAGRDRARADRPR